MKNVEWIATIKENRDEIRTKLECALKESLYNSKMQYTVYIDSDGDVWSHEAVSGSDWRLGNDYCVIRIFAGSSWSWTDDLPDEDCLKAVLAESTPEERAAYLEWRADHDYDDDTDASTLLSWWPETQAYLNCTINAVNECVDAYDADDDIDRVISDLTREDA